MSEKESHTIGNGVISTVLGGLVLSFILYLIPSLRLAIVLAFSWILSKLSWLWSAFTASYSVPVWLLLFVGLFALIGIIHFYQIMFSEGTPDPEFKKYTEDFIYDAKWRWSWDKTHISKLCCYCPTCDGQLVYDDNRSWLTAKTDFYCENCQRMVTSIKGGNNNYAVAAAEREILRRIRTKEYLKSI